MQNSDVIGALYRASADPSLWSDTLCTVADHVGAVAGNLVYQSPGGGRSFLIPGRMRDDLNALYLKHYTGNPYARAFEREPPNKVAIGNRLIDAEAVRRSAYYADICVPQEIYNQLFLPHTSLHQRGGIGGLALFLSERQSEHDVRAARRLDALVPHLARAIDFSLLTNQMNRGAQLLERLLASMSDAAVLLDREGGIILTNGAADQLLRKGDGLHAGRSERPELAVGNREGAQRLATGIRQSISVAEGRELAFEGALRIARPSGLPPYLVLLTPLPPPAFSLWDASDNGARVMVQIVDLQAKSDLQAERLRIMFGLTQAEARVAGLLGGGMGIAKIAKALKVSSNTVKTHARHCFDKTGVRTQAGLARLLASIPTPNSLRGSQPIVGTWREEDDAGLA